MKSTRLWAIVGATGTGKTGASIDLAQRLREERGKQVEIVNADAMQFYRNMNIGTAKLPATEWQGIEHHLFDVLDVTEEATVAWYQPAARATIQDIFSQGHDAILVGGSGLYVSSVLFDFKFPPRDKQLRAKLEAEAEAEGVQPLLDQLRQLDARAAEAVDAKNPRRVVRALEIALLGEAAQVTLPQQPTLWCDRTTVLGLHCERQVLVDRLDRRVEEMWRQGLLHEVSELQVAGIERGKTASRAIGYAQALAQLRHELSEAEAIAHTQALTRRYARRQVSWFKRYPEVRWIDVTNGQNVAHLAPID